MERTTDNVFSVNLTKHAAVAASATSEQLQDFNCRYRKALTLILSNWLSSTTLVNLKVQVCEMCFSDEPPATTNASSFLAQKDQKKNLRVEAYGSGAIILSRFPFDDETTAEELFSALQQHVSNERSFRLFLPNDVEILPTVKGSSNDEDWKTFNRLRHYGVVDNSVVCLVLLNRQEMLQRGTLIVSMISGWGTHVHSGETMY